MPIFPKTLSKTAARVMQRGFDIAASITVRAAAAGHAVQFRTAEKVAHILAALGIDKPVRCDQCEELRDVAGCRTEISLWSCRRRPRGTGAGGPRGSSFGLSRVGTIGRAVGDPVLRYVDVVSRDPQPARRKRKDAG